MDVILNHIAAPCSSALEALLGGAWNSRFSGLGGDFLYFCGSLMVHSLVT